MVIVDGNVEEEADDWEYIDASYKKSLLTNEVLEFLEFAEKSRDAISLNTFELFTGRYKRYIPPHKIKKKELHHTDIYDDGMFWIFEEADDIEFTDTLKLQNCFFMYECDNLAEIIMALMHSIAIHRFHICRCAVCGRHFVPLKRKDEKYCSRIRIDGKSTCKEIGKRQVRKTRLQKDTVTRKYNSVYTNLSNKKKAKKYADTQMQLIIEDRIKKLSTEFQSRKRDMDEESLLNWLDSMKHIE